MHHSNFFPMAVLLRAALLVLAASPLLSQQQMPAAAPRQSAVEGAYIPNRGQWDEDVRYKAAVAGHELWLTDDGWVARVQAAAKAPSQLERLEGVPQARPAGHVIRTRFVDAQSGQWRDSRPSGARINYLSVRTSIVDVPAYAEVVRHEIVTGVDARYYFESGVPRYDLIVRPGADPSEIAMKFEGALGVTRSVAGDLRLKTSVGDIVQRGLYAYQVINGAKIKVPCEFAINADVVSFEVGGYDSRLPLVIDPVITSTVLGGTGVETAFNMDVDAAGNAYLAGSADGAGFPVTVGAYDTSYQFNAEIVVSKIGTDGRLIWSTYVSGNHRDDAFDVAVGQDGEVFLVGQTGSSDFPATPDALRRTLHPPPVILDAFLLKLHKDGNAILYATLLGGTRVDYAQVIELDNGGNVFIGGQTSSPDFETTPGAFGGTPRNGFDIFVMKLPPTLDAMTYSTVFGSSLGEGLWDFALESDGSLFMCGVTNGTDFPTTAGAVKSTLTGTKQDGFVAHLNAAGSNLIASTYLGGAGEDWSMNLVLDLQGNPVVVGRTVSADFPVTPDAISPVYSGGPMPKEDATLSKLDRACTNLLYSTFVGKSETDWFDGIAIDAAGLLYVVGYSNSRDYPMTADAEFTDAPIGSQGVLSVFASATMNLVYSSFVGVNVRGEDVKLGPNGAINIAGRAYGGLGYYSPEAPDTVVEGRSDMLLVRYRLPQKSSILQNVHRTSSREIHVSPVPATSRITVRFESQRPVSALRLTNAMGETVRAQSFAGAAATDHLSIDVSELPNGVFALTIGEGPEQQHATIVVAR